MRSHPRYVRLSVVATLAVAVLTGSALPAAAGEPDPCSFAGSTLTVVVPSEHEGTLGRSGSAITFNGQPCGGATISTTDSIHVSVPSDAEAFFTIDLSAGPFAPGATDEQDGSSEIEIDVSTADQTPRLLIVEGSPFADFISVDDLADTVNLNTDEAVPDIDVTLDQVYDLFMIDGGDGADYLDTAYTAGHVIGGNGNDILGSIDNGEAQIDGAGGFDQVTFAASTAPIQLLGDGTDVIVGDPGGPSQQLSSIRAVRATNLDDQLTVGGNLDVLGLGGDDIVNVFEGDTSVGGGAGNDILNLPQSTPMFVAVRNGVGRGDGTVVHFGKMETLVGSEGEDRFVAGGRDLALDGRGGLDTYSVIDAARGVRIDLGTGTHQPTVSNGDTLASIERVIGSRFGDRIFGTANSEILSARGGDDVLQGLADDDVLLGGDGHDRLDGGGGTDECHGGAGLDVLLRC